MTGAADERGKNEVPVAGGDAVSSRSTASTLDLRDVPVLVVGAGIMGAGIAQVAALAGHRVRLFDVGPGAASQACDRLAATLTTLAGKGKLSADAARAAASRIEPIHALEEAADVGLVVEAIVERLDAKRALFIQLEDIVGTGTVLATNTSSISVTAIASGLRGPARVVGMHFFNPVPLMKLVEVVSGLQTAAEVAESVFGLSRHWGKVPVHAKSTPGFIVNRIARPYYAEALALLQEQAAAPEVIDACLRAAGFHMGPCELMDLIGHDTNFAVTKSVFEANFQDKRYQPSGLQREMVDGGLLGRKSGQGFYRYPEGAPRLPQPERSGSAAWRAVTIHGTGPVADALGRQAASSPELRDARVERRLDTAWTGVEVDGLRLQLTDGRTATEIAAVLAGTTDPALLAEVGIFDRPLVLPIAPGMPIAFATADDGSAPQAAAVLASLGFKPLHVADTPGLVAARTVAMLINEAADAVLQGVCTSEGADAAMKLGVNWPAGPFEWLATWNAREIAALLDALDTHHRGERYRVCSWLRRRAHAARG